MKGASDPEDVEHPKIPLPALHAPEIGAVKTCEICEPLLRDLSALPLGTHPCAESSKVTILHGAILDGVMPIRLQTMSSALEG